VENEIKWKYTEKARKAGAKVSVELLNEPELKKVRQFHENYRRIVWDGAYPVP